MPTIVTSHVFADKMNTFVESLENADMTLCGGWEASWKETRENGR